MVDGPADYPPGEVPIGMITCPFCRRPAKRFDGEQRADEMYNCETDQCEIANFAVVRRAQYQQTPQGESWGGD